MTTIPQQQNSTILIVGNPNVGKTTLFNHLSHKYAITANYPFTTIETNSASLQLAGQEFELIDTAGIYRLDFPSEEGQKTRELIFKNTPTIIIQVVESAKLEQSLLLTSQLLELHLPLIVVLNMSDELAKQGIRINSRTLSELLKTPVLEAVAVEGKGIDKIKKALLNVKANSYEFTYPPILKKYYQELNYEVFKHNRYSTALLNLIALNDPFAERYLTEYFDGKLVELLRNRYDRFLAKYVVNLSIIILNFRRYWIDKIINNTLTRKSEVTKYGIQKLGEWARHPIYGWLIMIAMILLTYLIVGKFGATFLVAQMEHFFFLPTTEYLSSLLTAPFINRFLVGDYGLLSTGLFNAIGTVLPIIILFFLVLNFLEDIGYLTNLIILTNRIFNKFGLTGKSILPIVLGFGCKTMATLSTKILDSKKEKYIAIFLIGLAIPCSSQMSIIIAVLSREPISAFFIVVAILTLVEIFSGLILNFILPAEKQSDLIIEIPPIRLPDWKLLIQKTYYRSLWFIKEAVPLFLLGALLLFVLHETSLIQLLESGLRPIIVDFLGLPIHFSEAMILSLTRSEAGAVLVMDMTIASKLTTSQVIVSIIVLTLFIPCISDVMAIIKELKWRKALIMVLTITLSSFMIGGLVNFLLKLIHYGG